MNILSDSIITIVVRNVAGYRGQISLKGMSNMIESIHTYYSLDDIPKPFIHSSKIHATSQDNNDMLFIMLLMLLFMDSENTMFDSNFIESLFKIFSPNND